MTQHRRPSRKWRKIETRRNERSSNSRLATNLSRESKGFRVRGIMHLRDIKKKDDGDSAISFSVSQKAHAQSRRPDVEASRRYDPTACIEGREGAPSNLRRHENAEIHAIRPPKHYVHANRINRALADY